MILHCKTIKITVTLFVLLLLVGKETHAQGKSRWLYFRELSRPERWWVITHPFSAGRALEISLHAREMSKQMEEHPGLDGDGRGGQVDAFRHVYWMALMTQKTNHRKAWRLGYDHEKGNKLYYEKHKDERSENLPTATDCTMDMYNNKAGIEIGMKYPEVDKEQLQEIILEKLLKGHFIILKKDTHGNLLDCEGNVLKAEEYDNYWDIPACLVPSDYNAQKHP